jgi:hypothetical protein
MQPAIFVSAIRARHLIVIIFSLGRSLRFAQNNRGFVEKLSQPLPKMVSRQKFCHPGNTGLETCAAHRLSSLCSVAVALPSLVADTDRLKSSAAWLQCFSTKPTSLPAREPSADTGCESKVWSAYMNISAKRITLTLPEIGLIAMTRGALGVGIGLLLSNALDKDERRSAGLALLAVGVLTTVPILMRLRNALK